MQTEEPESGNSIGKVAALLAPLAIGAGAMYYPKLASLMKELGKKALSEGDFSSRGVAKSLLRSPSVREGAVNFNVQDAPLSIMSHSARPGTQELRTYYPNPGTYIAGKGTARHDLEFGLTPPGMNQPIKAGSMQLLTDPTSGIGEVGFLGTNPSLRMHPSEFHNLQDRITQFLQTYGMQGMESSPLTASRARLFKTPFGGDVPPEDVTLGESTWQ